MTTSDGIWPTRCTGCCVRQTKWRVQDRLQLKIAGYHVQVYAMDSAFLHARTLFEFLTTKTGRNHYGANELGISPLESKPYNDGWKQSLHGYLMHAQARDEPEQLEASDGTLKDLNAMPGDFADEVTRLWTEMAEELRAAGQSDRADLVDEILREARLQAEPVLTNVITTQSRRSPRSSP